MLLGRLLYLEKYLHYMQYIFNTWGGENAQTLEALNYNISNDKKALRLSPLELCLYVFYEPNACLHEFLGGNISAFPVPNSKY